MPVPLPIPQPANVNVPRLEIIKGTVLGARKLDEGSSNDAWDSELLLADGTKAQAVTKDIPLREIAQELMGSALAFSCGLPVPRAFLVSAEQSIIPATMAQELAAGRRLLFGSERKSSPPLGRRLRNGVLTSEVLEALSAWPHCGATLAFDTWTANTDRNLGNILFETVDDIWLIDHGNCFKHSFWNPGDLVASEHYTNKMADWLCPELSTQQLQGLRTSVLHLCNTIRGMDIEAVGEASNAFSFLALEIREAIVTFLKDRAPLTSRITGAQTGIEGLLI